MGCLYQVQADSVGGAPVQFDEQKSQVNRLEGQSSPLLRGWRMKHVTSGPYSDQLGSKKHDNQ